MRVAYGFRGGLAALFSLGLAFAALSALAQEEYKPHVGQEGKDVVWVPTPQALVDKMLDMAQVTPKDYVIDLGSGDGRTVITAAKRGARAHGIEYNPDMVELAKRAAAKEGVSERATFEKADIFASDFSQATVITLFLLPGLNVKLRPTLLKLKPGTRIVSNTFTMGDWAADETGGVKDEDGSYYNTALLWIVPARVDGKWKFARGELVLKQQYQMLTGSLHGGGEPETVSGGRLRGDAISFRIGSARYSGRVSGSTMTGTVTTDGATSPWSATRVP
jgi:SAM-dependent methyltransferase